MSILVPQMSDLSNRAPSMMAVAPVSPRSQWQRGLPIAGTVNSIAAAADTLTPGEIYTAALADTTGALRASLKCLLVPPNCTYLELSAWGDGNAITTAPVLELWRSNHPNVSTSQAIVAGEQDFSRLLNLLGNVRTTMSTTVLDTTGAAGANRYVIDEATYQNQLYDVRGARLIPVKVITIGTVNNWSLWHRFF